MAKYTRRKFLETSLAAAAGLALGPGLVRGGPRAVADDVLPVPEEGYPLLEVAGSHRDIGFRIGTAMKDRIRGLLDHSREFSDCVAFLEGSGRDTLKEMLEFTRHRFPGLVEELEGMAAGLDVPFMSLFAFNCRSEIDVILNPPGCSTIALKTADQMLLVHNEDGSDLNQGRMFLVKATPPSGVTFISYVYPGLLPGNGPGFNKNGIVQTTNYIQPRRVARGVPRYFIGRAILETDSLKSAVELATLEPRAFPWHYNLASLPERRIISLETIADPVCKSDILEVDGLYIHTNHLLHPALAKTDESGRPPYDVPYISSTTRLRVLNEAIKKSGPPHSLADILDLLSLHEGRPYSPCRHPEGDVHGVTLGTAVFSAGSRAMTLYHGNPCRRWKKTYSI
jgi:hypothetical protein